MAQKKCPVIAVYPGSFDPVTLGHLDVISRAAHLFDGLVVGIGINPEKDALFTPTERVELLRPHLDKLPNARAESYDGLTFDFVQRIGGKVLVRGIRDASDLSNEMLQANLNRMIGGVETIFLLTSDEHVVTSSTYVKQIYEMDAGEAQYIHRLVPDNVAKALAGKLGRR